MNEFQSLVDLLDLQAVDIQIDRLLHQRQSLPELVDYQTAHAQSEQIAARLTEISAEFRQISLEEDKAEGELELLEQKMHQQEQRLFAGGLSARDTENLRRDVESPRRALVPRGHASLGQWLSLLIGDLALEQPDTRQWDAQLPVD